MSVAMLTEKIMISFSANFADESSLLLASIAPAAVIGKKRKRFEQILAGAGHAYQRTVGLGSTETRNYTNV